MFTVDGCVFPSEDFFARMGQNLNLICYLYRIAQRQISSIKSCYNRMQNHCMLNGYSIFHAVPSPASIYWPTRPFCDTARYSYLQVLPLIELRSFYFHCDTAIAFKACCYDSLKGFISQIVTRWSLQQLFASTFEFETMLVNYYVSVFTIFYSFLQTEIEKSIFWLTFILLQCCHL